MSGGDNSVSGGIILAGTLILLNWVIAYFTYKYKWFAKTVDGVPEVLIHDGRIVFSAIRRELITEDELMGALRKNGLEKISDVHIAIIEPSGAISVVAKK